jgi:hypothetical protein
LNYRNCNPLDNKKSLTLIVDLGKKKKKKKERKKTQILVVEQLVPHSCDLLFAVKAKSDTVQGGGDVVSLHITARLRPFPKTKQNKTRATNQSIGHFLLDPNSPSKAPNFFDACPQE